MAELGGPITRREFLRRAFWTVVTLATPSLLAAFPPEAQAAKATSQSPERSRLMRFLFGPAAEIKPGAPNTTTIGGNTYPVVEATIDSNTLKVEPGKVCHYTYDLVGDAGLTWETFYAHHDHNARLGENPGKAIVESLHRGDDFTWITHDGSPKRYTITEEIAYPIARDGLPQPVPSAAKDGTIMHSYFFDQRTFTRLLESDSIRNAYGATPQSLWEQLASNLPPGTKTLANIQTCQEDTNTVTVCAIQIPTTVTLTIDHVSQIKKKLLQIEHNLPKKQSISRELLLGKHFFDLAKTVMGETTCNASPEVGHFPEHFKILPLQELASS